MPFAAEGVSHSSSNKRYHKPSRENHESICSPYRCAPANWRSKNIVRPLSTISRPKEGSYWRGHTSYEIPTSRPVPDRRFQEIQRLVLKLPLSCCRRKSRALVFLSVSQLQHSSHPLGTSSEVSGAWVLHQLAHTSYEISTSRPVLDWRF